MTSSILCAVDISNGDDDVKTLQRAAQIAELDGAQLDVIAVVPDFGMSQVGDFFGSDHHEKMVDAAKSQLNALVLNVLGDEINEGVRHIVSTGRAYDEVLRAADAAGSSLIVVGAHKADLADYLIGPNSSRIVRHAKCSVYVVR